MTIIPEVHSGSSKNFKWSQGVEFIPESNSSYILATLLGVSRSPALSSSSPSAINKSKIAFSTFCLLIFNSSQLQNENLNYILNY